MNRLRSALILVLFLLPILFFVALGAYALFALGWMFWTWWLLPACWGLAYYLARRGSWKASLHQLPNVELPAYWTPRDRDAWQIVERAASTAPGIAPQSLLEPTFYLRSAETLLLDVARHYHPKATDPMAPVTISELLTVAQLAIEDLAELFDVYVPGSRHMTVARWRSMSKLPQWYGIASNIGYLVSAAFGPAAAASRFLLSKLVLSPALQVMQDNLLYWFYAAYLQRVGLYAVELNSGRLRVGAARWRMLVKASQSPSHVPSPRIETSTVEESLTITVAGQLKAGKSSLINALLDRSDAAYDALPTTRVVSKYELVGDNWIGSLVLQDTAGYGGTDHAHQAMQEAVEAGAASDIVLLVADALNAGREADRKFLEAMRTWFETRAELRRPPIIVVLTHVDLLSPAMEWEPPYEAWRGGEPSSPKDEMIRKAVEQLTSTVFSEAAAVIPVCAGPTSERVYGVEEWLLPAIMSRLEEARAVLLLRALHREGKQNLWRRLWSQTTQAGSVALRNALGGRPT